MILEVIRQKLNRRLRSGLSVRVWLFLSSWHYRNYYRKGGEKMVRKINVVFTDSESDEFGASESEVYLLANDITLDRYDNEAVIRMIDEPVNESQEVAHIDLATCGRLEVSFLALDNPLVDKLGLDWIVNASFIEVIRALAEKGRLQ